MGLNSDEATNANLILCARAARRRRSAALTYFFFPRGLVADLRELDDFTPADFAEADFFLSAADLAAADPDTFFFWLVVDAVALVALALGAS